MWEDFFFRWNNFFKRGLNLKIKISEVIIKDRIRENIGDMEKLIESMKRNGLINPITITDDHELIAGYRRLNAAIELGWEYIHCHIVKVESKIQKLQIEADENLARKDFSVDEIIKLNDKKIYLSSGPFEKFKLLLKKIVINITMWLKLKLNKNKGK